MLNQPLPAHGDPFEVAAGSDPPSREPPQGCDRESNYDRDEGNDLGHLEPHMRLAARLTVAERQPRRAVAYRSRAFCSSTAVGSSWSRVWGGALCKLTRRCADGP